MTQKEAFTVVKQKIEGKTHAKERFALKNKKMKNTNELYYINSEKRNVSVAKGHLHHTKFKCQIESCMKRQW